MFNFHLTVEKDFFGVNFKIFSHAIQLERVISSLDIEHFLGLLSSKNVLTKQNHTYPDSKLEFLQLTEKGMKIHDNKQSGKFDISLTKPSIKLMAHQKIA